MTASLHIRGEVFESVGVFSGAVFFKFPCSCGWLALDVADLGLARDQWARHASAAAVAR